MYPFQYIKGLAVILAGAMVLAMACPCFAQREKDRYLQIRYSPERSEYRHGEQVAVDVSVKNMTEMTVCSLGDLRAPQDWPEKALGIELVLLRGFEKMPPSGGYGKSEYAVVSLQPGEERVFHINLSARYRDLPPDVYELSVQQRVPGVPAASQYENNPQCQLWSRRSFGQGSGFSILASDPAAETARWMDEWRKGRSFRSLQWLADNALKPGMTRDQVRDLLGSPSSVDDGRKQWRYWAGMTGIIISFGDGKVSHIAHFEEGRQ